MEIVKFIYLDQEVEFEIGKTNVMVNATEMAKIFGKEVEEFTRNKSTQNFINECLKHCKNKTVNTENSRYSSTENQTLINQNSGFISEILNIESKEDLIISKPKTGTWMHKVLALKFAAWLEPAFELWVYATIDVLVNSYFKEQKEALVIRETAKQKKKINKELILKNYSHFPEIAEYFEFDDVEKNANKKHSASIRNQVKQLRLDFNF